MMTSTVLNSRSPPLLFRQCVFEAFVLLSHDFEIHIQAPRQSEHSQAEVIADTELMMQPAHAWELFAGGRFVARHHGQSADAECTRLGNRRRERGVELRAVALGNIVGVRTRLPRALRALQAFGCGHDSSLMAQL